MLDKKCEAGPSLQDLWNCWDAVYGGKQEPVAWRIKVHEYDEETDESSFPWKYHHIKGEGQPLYLHPAQIPEGWQLVPIEPTEEMIDASELVKQYELGTPWRRWEAMLAAAPKLEDV